MTQDLTYLGDDVYCFSEGFQIVLRGNQHPSDDSTDQIVLTPEVMTNLLQKYYACQSKKVIREKKMNKKLMEQAGFAKEVAVVESGHCPFCGKVLVGLFVVGSDDTEGSEFRDALSFKEYKISGLCQNCQDNVFKA